MSALAWPLVVLVLGLVGAALFYAKMPKGKVAELETRMNHLGRQVEVHEEKLKDLNKRLEGAITSEGAANLTNRMNALTIDVKAIKSELGVFHAREKVREHVTPPDRPWRPLNPGEKKPE